jgi:hypothetical protein
MEEDSALVVVLTRENEKFLYTYRPGADQWDQIFAAGVNDISYPTVAGNRIFFNATYSGIDNIYSYDMASGEAFQVTSSRFGAFHPHLSPNDSLLYYADYGAMGHSIASMPLDQGLWTPLEESVDRQEQQDFEPTPEEEAALLDMAEMDTTTRYAPERYRKLRHLFQVHSWLPLYVDYLDPSLTLNPEDIPVSLGVSLISQNHLSTAVSQLGYEYKNGYHMLHTGIQLKGRYPVLNLYLDYGGEPNILLLNEAADTAMALPTDLTFRAETYIPFRLNTGKFLSLVQPGIDYTYNRDLQYIEDEGAYRSGVHYMRYTLFATSYLRQGIRDILPRLGMSLNGSYFHAPFDNQVYGAVSNIGLTAYLPGFLKHQTIRLSVMNQKQYPLDPNRPAFINLMSQMRGRSGIFGEDLTRFTADYVFPVLYPDLELTALLYIQRIRAAVWTDYMAGTNVVVFEPSVRYEDRQYQSVGIDLLADVNIFRVDFPISFGGRFIYEVDTGRSSVEILYSIDIN